MDENEIAFSGTRRFFFWYVTVLKFLNFSFAERTSSELKENPEDNEDFKKEIVQLKLKKIDDYVDFEF